MNGEIDMTELEQRARRLVAENPCANQADIREMLSNEIAGRIKEHWIPENMRNLTDA